MLTRDRFVGFGGRRLADLLTRQAGGDRVALPVHFGQGPRRDEHLALHEPGAGIHDEVARNPVLIIKVKLTHCADLTVGCGQRAAAQGLELFEHGHYGSQPSSSSDVKRLRPMKNAAILRR